MRSFHRVGLVIVAVALSAPAFARDAQPVRAAEVLLMGVQARSALSTQEPVEPGKRSSFRLLNLARNTVGDVMGDSFGSLALGVAPTNSEPVPAAVSPFSDIAVPGWMRAPMLSNLPALGGFVPGCVALPYRPSGFLQREIEARRRAAYDAMNVAACEAGVPVGLFDALVLRESAYNPRAVSPKNAYGLAQLMPGTAAGLGVDRYDPIQNLRGGARYLRAQLDTFGQVPLALAAYNAGPGRVKGGRIPAIAETRAYVRDVIDKWARLAGQHRVVSVTPFLGAMPGPDVVPPSVQKALVQQF